MNWTLVLISSIILGLIPATIAKNKGHNFFLWWLFGAALFIVALPMAILEQPYAAKIEQQQIEDGISKRCPYCAEIVKSEAKVCKYCGRDLPFSTTSSGESDGLKNLPKLPVIPRRSASLWVQILVWVGLLALLVLLGLGLFRAQNPIISIGSKVPDFTLKLFDDYQYQGAGQVNLASLRGKVVVVNIWASWCVTCADEAPDLEAAWRYYQPDGRVVFLGVDYTDVDSKALDFLSKFEITYPNGPDLGTRITPIFNRNIAMPETYIIDQQGILRYKQIGPFQSLAEIRSAIDPLLDGR